VTALASLLPVITGFLLTSVLGGLLGFFFQNRSWEHQHKIQQAEQERQRQLQLAEQARGQALAVFDEISRLMDKRLYRLRLVCWSLQGDDGQSEHSRLARSRFKDYQQVLYEWNDSINRNLALLQHYFEPRIRQRLDNQVGGTFVELGRVIEEWWRTGVRPQSQEAIDARLRTLGSLVYQFNLDMIRAIGERPGNAWVAGSHHLATG
jgi:hypothetical protein